MSDGQLVSTRFPVENGRKPALSADLSTIGQNGPPNRETHRQELPNRCHDSDVIRENSTRSVSYCAERLSRDCHV